MNYGILGQQERGSRRMRCSSEQASRGGHSTLGFRKLCPAKRASSPSSSSILTDDPEGKQSGEEGSAFLSGSLQGSSFEDCPKVNVPWLSWTLSDLSIRPSLNPLHQLPSRSWMQEIGWWPNGVFSPRSRVLLLQGPSSPHELVVLRQTFRSAWGTSLDLKQEI